MFYNFPKILILVIKKSIRLTPNCGGFILLFNSFDLIIFKFVREMVETPVKGNVFQQLEIVIYILLTQIIPGRFYHDNMQRLRTLEQPFKGDL